MIKKLQTLYKVDTKGKLREWTMHIDGASFYAVKGLVDGKLTIDKPTKTSPRMLDEAMQPLPKLKQNWKHKQNSKRNWKVDMLLIQ